MRKKTNSSGLLVVVELGGEWPALMQADVAIRRVLSQSEGETPAEFAERVASSLDCLFGPGVKLTTVALACNERVDPAADSARRKLCSLSLGAMARQRGSRLYLTASARSSGRLHHTLSGLAQDFATAGLEVSVEFGEESRSSINAAPAPSARVA